MKFLECLERDPDAEINMFHPLAKNFIDGQPLYLDLPEGCMIKKIAALIKEQRKYSLGPFSGPIG